MATTKTSLKRKRGEDVDAFVSPPKTRPLYPWYEDDAEDSIYLSPTDATREVLLEKLDHHGFVVVESLLGPDGTRAAIAGINQTLRDICPSLPPDATWRETDKNTRPGDESNSLRKTFGITHSPGAWGLHKALKPPYAMIYDTSELVSSFCAVILGTDKPPAKVTEWLHLDQARNDSKAIPG